MKKKEKNINFLISKRLNGILGNHALMFIIKMAIGGTIRLIVNGIRKKGDFLNGVKDKRRTTEKC